MMPKVTYEVDPHSRLIIKKTGRKSQVPKYRRVADGRFKIGKKNSLTYHIKKSKDFKSPQQIKFSGNWSLDKRRNLVLTLNKWCNQIAGNKLTIKGEVADINKNSVLFAVTTKTAGNRRQIYTLELSGSWQADKNNRLTFNAEKERGNSDVLMLSGAWKVNEKGQLIYKYSDKKKIHTLIFRGNWEVTDKFKLSYELENGKAITISGRWKIDENKGLLFEAKHKGGRFHTVVFGGTVKLAGRNMLEISLNNTRRRASSLNLKLSRKFLSGCGEKFIKALASGKELSIVAGVGIIW